MARERKLVVVIAGDSKGAVGALDQLEKKSDSTGSKLKDLGGKMAAFGKKASLAVTLPVVAAGAVVFQAASHMNESISKVNSVFGDSAAAIQEWSKTAAKNLGISRQEALDAAGSFGNLFLQLGFAGDQAVGMSKGLVGLATDFASFFDSNPADALEAVTAAFRGEFDAVQKFVPTINAATVEQRALADTGKKTTDELTAQEKALAVNELLMEGAGKAAGDFARTSGGAAGQQKILTAQFKDAAATIGQKLMPIAMKLMEWVTGLVDWFGKLSPKTQNIILIMIGLAAAIGPVVTVVGALVAVVGFLAANPIVLLIAALVALGIGLKMAYDHFGWFHDAVDKAWQILQGIWDWVTNNWEKIGAILLLPFWPVIAAIEALMAAWNTLQSILHPVSVGKSNLGHIGLAEGATFGGKQIHANRDPGRAHAAAGGIFPARPGGWDVNLAEAGEDEAVIPLGRGMAAMGAHVTVAVDLRGAVIADKRQLLDMLAEAARQGHRAPELRKLLGLA